MTRYKYEVRVPGTSGDWNTFETVSRHLTIMGAIHASTKLEDKMRRDGKEPRVLVAVRNDEKPSCWSSATEDGRPVIWWD